MSGRERGGDRGGAASPLERVVVAATALLVLGAAGFLLRSGMQPQTPPRITLQVDSVVRAGERWLVEFRAHNGGRTTASGLVVEASSGAARGGRAEPDDAGLRPRAREPRGGLSFGADPGRGSLRIRPTGYERP